MALIEQSKKISLSLFPTRPSNIEVFHAATNRSNVTQTSLASADTFNSLLHYLDTITAPILAFFATLAERTCPCSQWITERIHHSVPSTAASKINGRETAEKVENRNICIGADRNQRTSTVYLAGENEMTFSYCHRQHLYAFVNKD